MENSACELTDGQIMEINFLLTEVSLELLGNSFYDIHGQKQNGLASLYNVCSMPGTNNLHCDLIKELDMEYLLPKNTTEDFLTPITAETNTSKPEASPTITSSCRPEYDDFESSNSNPTKDAQKKAKRRRRQTTTAMKPSPPAIIEVEKTEQEIEENAKRDVVRTIKRMVETETGKMVKNSDNSKEEYYIKNSHRIGAEYETIDENDLVEEYYERERINLSEESTKLMQLIKFMKSDPRNSSKMKKIAANILLVKDLI